MNFHPENGIARVGIKWDVLLKNQHIVNGITERKPKVEIFLRDSGKYGQVLDM